MNIRVRALLGGYLGCAMLSPFATAEGNGLKGDIRLEVGTSQVQARDGTSSSAQSSLARAGIGYDWQLNEKWRLVTHAATRYDSSQSVVTTRSGLLANLSTEDGLNSGDATIDDLHFSYKRVEDKEVQIGRMQVAVFLPGVNKKSLSRNDSSETQISWTDGMRFSFKDAKGWQNQVVFASTLNAGSTTVQRSPLNYGDRATRWTFFFAGDKVVDDATWYLKGFTFTHLPSVLCRDGVSSCANRSDYSALVVREGWQWPLLANGKFLLGVEAGLASNTPLSSTLNLPGSGDAGGSSWQVSLDMLDFAVGHSAGVVMARADGGWLISPSFRNNSASTEWRYRWLITTRQTLTVGWFTQEDLLQPLTATQRLQESRGFLRYDVNF